MRRKRTLPRTNQSTSFEQNSSLDAVAVITALCIAVILMSAIGRLV
jgi:hypothetical protein